MISNSNYSSGTTLQHKNPPAIFSVSALNDKIKQLIESSFTSIWLEAEISNLVKASSGHWYLTLKDNKSQIKCAMFKGANRHVRFSPQNGEQVLIKANVSLYHPRGEYQLIIDTMAPAGLGKLQQAFDDLKIKLSNAGLFSTEYKKPLPDFVNQVAIVTSAKGAAIHDMLSIFKRLAPHIAINIYPCSVQGEQAKYEIVKQIQNANKNSHANNADTNNTNTSNSHANNDLIIVSRGGGSLEDLWAFNEEIVAQAIHDSQRPIISAVGHETDVTIADFVADLRAATPSAAAEIVSRISEQMVQAQKQQVQRLNLTINQQLTRKQQKLNQLALRLQQQDPKSNVQAQLQTLDNISWRLGSALQSKIQNAKNKLTYHSQKLADNTPEKKRAAMNHAVNNLSDRLTQQTVELQKDKQHKLNVLIGQLNAYSPLATLSRGYSVTKITQGKKQITLQNTHQINVGDIITTQLNQGEITSEITALNNVPK